MLLVEGDRPGLRRGPTLAKLSLRCEDTCELFFEDLRVPASNLLGAEGTAFAMLMAELPWERLQIAMSAVVFFASDESSFSLGSELIVDGGMTGV